MNPLLLKSVGGIFALSAAAAAGVGISHAYSGSSSGEESPKPASEADNNPSPEQVTKKAKEVKKVKEGSLSEDRRWLVLNEDAIEWRSKIDKYKAGGKNDLKEYGFEWEEVEQGTENRNVTNMQKACESLLGRDFGQNLFKVASEWCSVEKKIRWSLEQDGSRRALLLEGTADDRKWEDKANRLKDNADVLGGFGISKENAKKEDLKKKCEEFGGLELSSENNSKKKLFRDWCMVKRVVASGV